MEKSFLFVPVKKEKKPEGEQNQDVRVDRKNNARLCLQYMDSTEYLDDMDHLENVLDGYRRMNAFDRVNYGLEPSGRKRRQSPKSKKEKKQKQGQGQGQSLAQIDSKGKQPNGHAFLAENHENYLKLIELTERCTDSESVDMFQKKYDKNIEDK